MEGYITLRNLRLTYSQGLDAWGRPGKPQPILVSVRLRHKNIEPAAANDDCSKTTSYSDVAKAVIKAYEIKPSSPERSFELAHQYLMMQMTSFQAIDMSVETRLPKAFLRVDGGYALRTESNGPARTNFDCIDVFNDLKLACIIGVNPHEREQKQMIVLNLQLWRAAESFVFETMLSGPSWPVLQLNWPEYQQLLVSEIVKHTEASSFKTVEALALMLLHTIERQHCWVKAIVQVEKPSAIAIADLCGAELHKSWDPQSWI